MVGSLAGLTGSTGRSKALSGPHASWDARGGENSSCIIDDFSSLAREARFLTRIFSSIYQNTKPSCSCQDVSKGAGALRSHDSGDAMQSSFTGRGAGLLTCRSTSVSGEKSGVICSTKSL